MEIDDMVPVSGHVPVPIVSEDPYVADLLKVADENIARLREEARIAREETTGLEGKISNLQHQVSVLFCGVAVALAVFLATVSAEVGLKAWPIAHLQCGERMVFVVLHGYYRG